MVLYYLAMNDGDTKTLQVVLRKEAYEQLRQKAKVADKSLSVFLREHLEAFFSLLKFEGRR